MCLKGPDDALPPGLPPLSPYPPELRPSLAYVVPFMVECLDDPEGEKAGGGSGAAALISAMTTGLPQSSSCRRSNPSPAGSGTTESNF